MCRSMLRERSKQRSIGAAIFVVSSMRTIVMPLQPRTFLRDQPFDLLHKLRRQHILRLFFPPRTDIHPARFRFFIPNYDEEWHSLHGVLADFSVHFLIA